MNKKSKLPILYEDDYIVAINKPPRMATVPSADIPINETLLGKVQRLFEEKGIKPYVLHRLDFQTSGVILFGKHEKDRGVLENIFRHADTKKTYLALVKGVPNGKTITKTLKARASSQFVPAQTNYRIVKVFRMPLCALVEAEIHTGRKHQIRKHFALVGHPIILDSVYGDARFNRKFRIALRIGRQFLHAAFINFYHPFLKKYVKIEAPFTPDLQSVLKKLNFYR